jgi:hypothetical protein
MVTPISWARLRGISEKRHDGRLAHRIGELTHVGAKSAPRGSNHDPRAIRLPEHGGQEDVDAVDDSQ